MIDTNADATRQGLRGLVNRSVAISVAEQGTMTLRSCTLNDLIFLEDLLDEALSAREFVERLLEHQLVTSTSALDAVQTWDDTLLLQCATAWMQHEELLAEAAEAPHTLDEVQQQLTAYIKEHRRKLRSILQPQLAITQRLSRDLLPSLYAPGMQAVIRQMTTLQLDGGVFAVLRTLEPQWQLSSRALTQALRVLGPELGRITSAYNVLASNTNAANIVAESVTPMLETLEVIKGTLARWGTGLAALQFDVGRLFPRLPDIWELIANRERFREETAEAALDEEGFGFSHHLWDIAACYKWLRRTHVSDPPL